MKHGRLLLRGRIISVFQEKGFTLIELLIVIMTLALLFGLGYANYRGFQRRQVLEGAVRTVRADLRLAQELALAGKKPDTTPNNTCETSVLIGYTFRRQSNSAYLIQAHCVATPDYYHTVKGPVSLPTGTTISPIGGGNIFDFKVVSGGINRSFDVTITLNFSAGGVVSRDIVITPSGVIK